MNKVNKKGDTEKDFGIKESVIPFGASDSELMHQEINIPEGFEATIEGNKIILKKTESEDEKVREYLIKWIQDNYYHGTTEIPTKTLIAWLERQGSEPKWCHHKVDLSGCSEEYRKAYYDGWNNCNQQHSQCKSEWNDVVKCLINGMKFYYEDNEEATWGTEKFSMKVKDILSWLEKQYADPIKEYWRGYNEGKQNVLDKYAELEKQDWSEEDEHKIKDIVYFLDTAKKHYASTVELDACIDWLKSLKDKYTWKPSDEQIGVIEAVINNRSFQRRHLDSLYEQLKKLKE